MTVRPTLALAAHGAAAGGGGGVWYSSAGREPARRRLRPPCTQTPSRELACPSRTVSSPPPVPHPHRAGLHREPHPLAPRPALPRRERRRRPPRQPLSGARAPLHRPNPLPPPVSCQPRAAAIASAPPRPPGLRGALRVRLAARGPRGPVPPGPLRGRRRRPPPGGHGGLGGPPPGEEGPPVERPRGVRRGGDRPGLRRRAVRAPCRLVSAPSCRRVLCSALRASCARTHEAPDSVLGFLTPQPTPSPQAKLRPRAAGPGRGVHPVRQPRGGRRRRSHRGSGRGRGWGHGGLRESLFRPPAAQRPGALQAAGRGRTAV